MYFHPIARAFFWDGRATSLEEQALEPIANPIEMATSHARMVETLSGIRGYRPYFVDAFGDRFISQERVVQAIADYERTRMSGNSPADRWLIKKNDRAVPDEVKRGFTLFVGKARCNECHGTGSFTDGQFHNTGVGWNPITKTFSDEGRDVVTRGTVIARFGDADRGAFKTPTLREVTKHAPYMHDGLIKTLREVIEFYNRGAVDNPYLDAKIVRKPLGLTTAEIDAILAFLAALDGEGWQDVSPSHFPR